MGEAAMSRKAKSSVKVTVADQTLPTGMNLPPMKSVLDPWGSVVHWQEIFRGWVSSGERGKVSRWFVPVTCGNPSGNDKCEGKRPVHVMSVTQHGALSVNNLATRGMVFTGLCKYCFLKKIRINPRMPDGSEFEMPDEVGWSGFTRGGLGVICGKCQTKQTLECTLPIADDLAWNCLHCGHAIGEHPHPNGATVLWLVHWLRRILERPGKNTQVPFSCAKCGTQGRVWSHAARLKGEPPKKWQGLCTICLKQWHPRSKITEEVTLKSASRVFNARREGSRVPVKCGLLGCGKENWFNVFSTRRRSFTGYCPSHTYEDLITRAPGQSPNVHVHNNGTSKKRGPEKGQYAFITWGNMKEAFARADGYPTKAKVAKALGVSESGIDKWLGREKTGWRAVQQRFMKDVPVPHDN